jgi:anaerobic ribonucleoside-triphosphate reductase
MQTVSAVLDQEVESILTPEERQPCEVWTRVMGYFRPVASFNNGKKGEFHERKSFLEPHCD